MSATGHTACFPALGRKSLSLRAIRLSVRSSCGRSSFWWLPAAKRRAAPYNARSRIRGTQMFVRFRRHLFALTVAAAVVACGGDSSTRPTSYPPATLNQALAELSIPALAAGGPSFLGVDAATPALDPTNCPYSATVQSFVCTPISESGLTVNQSFTLLTGSGGKQSAFDAATTDAARPNTTGAGTLVGQGTTLDVTGEQELTQSGLDSGPHVLN